MRAVITRPIEDAERSADQLRALGAEVMIEPLLVVMPAAAAEVSLDGVQAFLLTSANGARALASFLTGPSLHLKFEPLTLPALCVGDQTMRTARQLGFQDVRSAGGNVTSLAALVRQSLSPDKGALLHAAGSARAGDLSALLEQDGFDVRRSVLYETRPAVAFSREFAGSLKDGAIDAVLFYSPRTAATFATLAGTASLSETLASVTAYCLSKAVADAIGSLPFKALRVAPSPTQDALFGLLKSDYPTLAPAGHGADGVLPRTSGPSATSDRQYGDSSMSDRPKASESSSSSASSSAATDAGKAAKPTSAAAGSSSSGTSSSAASSSTGSAATGAKSSIPKSSAPSSSTVKTSASASPAGTKKPSRSVSGKTVARVVAGVVVLGVVGYASLPWWVDSLPPTVKPLAYRLLPTPAAQTDLAAMQDQIAALEQNVGTLKGTVGTLQDRIAHLEDSHAATMAGVGQSGSPSSSDTGGTETGTNSGAISGVAPGVGADAIVTQRLAALESTVGHQQTATADQLQSLQDGLQSVKESSASASAVLGLSDRVAGLENKVGQAQSRQDHALAFLLAVGQLRTAVETGRSFEDEMKMVTALAPDGVDVGGQTAPFRPLAGTGIPTLTALQQSFAALGAKVIRASALPDETAGWWSRTVDRLLTVITVRRIDGDALGDGPAAVVSRTEALLNHGALSEAVSELEKLSGASAEVAAPWLAQATARVAADQALNDLTSEALASLTASEAPAPEKAATPAGKEG